jgi:predicted small integral membrane protein
VEASYPIRFSVDYPDRDLDRLTSFLRLFVAIPILIVLATVSGGTSDNNVNGRDTGTAVAGGLLFLGPLLMIVFRRKYPRWWFDWNKELARFVARVAVYLALMDDRYPSTDEQQSVHLEFEYPAMPDGLNRWLPLVKWFLAIPHYIALFFLAIASFFVVLWVWLSILFTGRYPRGAFTFVEGVMRWANRVIAYAFLFVTDQYPPFSLA